MARNIQTDSQGRLNLGKQYASATFIVEVQENTDIVLKKAAVIPERELWLLNNPDSLKSVQKGLQDAKEDKLHLMNLEEFDD